MTQHSETAQQTHVINSIESIFAAMLEELENPDGKLVIELKSQSTARESRFINRETNALEVPRREQRRVLSFPARRHEDQLRFSGRIPNLIMMV
jgi:hypothetical protein